MVEKKVFFIAQFDCPSSAHHVARNADPKYFALDVEGYEDCIIYKEAIDEKHVPLFRSWFEATADKTGYIGCDTTESFIWG